MKPKRILVIGSDWPENEIWCPHWVGMKIGLKRIDIPHLFVSCRPTLNVDVVVSFQPDLIIYGLNDMVKHPEWRQEINQRLPDAVKVIWYGDLRNEKTMQIDADCSEIDCMFVSNDAQEEYYKHKWRVPKVKFLPLGCEPVKKPIYDERFAWPFVFIGGRIASGAFAPRAKEIEEFAIVTDLTIVNSYEPEIRSRIYRAMPAIYSSSKVALDISHFTDVKKYTSIRYWEIPAYYGFALTKRWPGCEEFYPPTARVYFDTFDEAVEKVAYYSKHESERRQMVDLAHALSYNHTYDKRLQAMFTMI